MIRDFFYWLKRYSKSKFFKLVLFFAIFCIISLCRKCDVYAAWYGLGDTNPYGLDTSNSNITYNFSKLNYNSDTGTLYHKSDYSVSTNFNFSSSSQSSVVDTKDFLILKNIVIDYKYSTTHTIDNSNWKYLGFNFNNFFIISGNGSYFTFLKNSTLTQRETYFTSFPSFYPYYAEYFDTTSNEWKPVPSITLRSWGERSMNLVATLPNGTTLNEIKFYFGTEKNYFGSLTDINTHIRTENNSIDNSYFNYYTRTFDMYNYRDSTNTNDYGFLAYLPKLPSSNFSNLVTSPSTSLGYNGFEGMVSHGSNMPNGYAGATINFTGTLQDIIDEATENDQANQEEIENYNQQYLIIGGATSDDLNTMDSNYSSAVDSFTSSSSSTNFTGLFTSLFAYPIQKLYEMKDIDLYNENYVNLGICTGSNNITGDWNDRLQIKIAKPGTDSDTWYYELPCPHYDIYYQIRHGNYSLMGSNSGMLYNGHITFEFIWRSVLRGLLIYWLFVTCLGIYKYILDPEDTKVEVLDL